MPKAKTETISDGFGPGAYYDPRCPNNVVVQEERFQFLRAADAKANIEHALRIDVYPLFERSWSRGGHLVEARTALEKWARRSNLYCEWALDAAIYTMKLWMKLPELEVPLGFYTAAARVDLGGVLEFCPPSWNASAESEESYVRRVNVLWEQVLCEHLVQTKAEQHVQDHRQVPRRRDTTGSPWRYEWLALRQCLKWGYSRIADEYTPPGARNRGKIVTVDQVSAAVRQLRKTIGLPSNTRLLAKPYPVEWESFEQQRRRFDRGEVVVFKITT